MRSLLFSVAALVPAYGLNMEAVFAKTSARNSTQFTLSDIFSDTFEMK